MSLTRSFSLPFNVRTTKRLQDVCFGPASDRQLYEFFVIADGANQRQVQAIADEINEQLKKQFGRRPVRIEGYGTAEWVLLDYGDFVIHLFDTEARDFYDLERLWRDAGKVELPESIERPPINIADEVSIHLGREDPRQELEGASGRISEAPFSFCPVRDCRSTRVAKHDTVEIEGKRILELLNPKTFAVLLDVGGKRCLLPRTRGES